MKKGLVWIVAIVLFLGIAFAVINFNKKQIVCPELELKNCTEGKSIIIDSNNCPISICEEELIKTCNSTGGNWVTFSNGCADRCNVKTCTMAFTTDCDCGPDKCWDERSLSCKLG